MTTEPTPGPHAGMYPTITRKPRRWPWIVGIVAALFAGLVVGVAAAAPAPAADAEPEPAVTVTAEPEVITETETVTETVEVEVVPQACLDALDLAADGFGAAADVMGVLGDLSVDIADILNADGYLVTAEWNDLDAKYAPLVDEAMASLDADTAGSAAQECRALAEDAS